jgi:hypothetical protein
MRIFEAEIIDQTISDFDGQMVVFTNICRKKSWFIN